MLRHGFHFCCSAFACAWLALGAATAQGVVITSNTDGPYTRAPSDDPGWGNLATYGNGTAVYVGRQWMLTANHVNGSSVQFTDGRTFEVSKASDARFTNFFGGQADLKMFRLIEDPGLPSLAIANQQPALASSVLMIGAGDSRDPNLVGWTVDASSTWKEVSPTQAMLLGYKLNAALPSVMRWGTNQVDTRSEFSGNTFTFSFTTSFGSHVPDSEAQAVIGDSGGAVFAKIDGQWQLTGIITSQQLLSGQTQNEVVYGNQTVAAQLSGFHDVILDTLTFSPWQNQLSNLDVDRSGIVAKNDALALKSEILLHGIHDLSGGPKAGDLLFDVDGDGSISTLDLLRVQNRLLRIGLAKASVLAAPLDLTLVVPEPASGRLALLAGALAIAPLAARRVRAARSTRQAPLTSSAGS